MLKLINIIIKMVKLLLIKTIIDMYNSKTLQKCSASTLTLNAYIFWTIDPIITISKENILLYYNIIL